MSIKSACVIYDKICQIAARRLGANIAMIVDCGRAAGNNIRGSVGCNHCHLENDARIPGLRSSQRDLFYFPDMKQQQWFESHSLKQIAPRAKTLLAVSIPTMKKGTHRYLAVIDPQSKLVKNLQVSSILSDLTSLASGLFDIESSRAAVETTIRNATRLRVRDNGFESPAQSADPRDADEMASFLFRTLPTRKGLHVRNGIGYMTLRAWRKQGRDIQMAAMQALKRSKSEFAEKTIASEIAGFATQINGNAYDAVVPVPGGSSNDANCLSVRLAREVSRQMSLPFINCLSPQPSKGRSHPRKSARLKPYEVTNEISGRVLLIDDVATTGTHLEYAATALRKAGANPTLVAWIGPTTAKS